MLLIFPPVAKPGEPPAGIARLAAALAANHIDCTILDANIEGLLWMIGQPQTPTTTWTRRALRHADGHLASLRDPATYASPDRYGRAVRDLQRVLASYSEPQGAVIGLADYQDARLSPLRSGDLLHAAAHPELSPFYPWFSGRLPGLLDADRSGFIGFSLNYLSQALTTFAMIGFARRIAPGLRIVLGGGLITSWMSRPGWRNPFTGLIDQLVAGPGEGPLLDLLGVERSVPHAPPEYRHLEELPYLSPGFVLPYSASSGCYWNRCSFCPEQAEGSRYIPVTAAMAASEIGLLASKTRASLIHLLDNAISPALMRALIAEPPGAPWYGFARVGDEMLDPDFCVALRRSGCVMVKLGIESGDQQVLDALRKGMDIGVASRALRNLKRAGIATYVYLLFGAPPETRASALRTLEFTAAHADAITFLNLAIFNMPVNGPEREQFDAEPFSDGDLSLYAGFRHPAGWDRKSVRRFLDAEFRRHPAIAAIMRHDPPVFTSNHAAFMCMNPATCNPPAPAGGGSTKKGVGNQ